jgi:hypothetical protein
MVPDITATPPAEGPQRVPIRKGRVSGESEKVSPGRLGRTPLPVLLVCLCNTQLGATPEARRRGARAPALAWPGTSGKHRHGGRQHHTGEQQQSTGNGGNGSAQTPSVFFPYFRGVRRPVAFVAGARGLLVCAGEAGPRSRDNPARPPERPQRCASYPATHAAQRRHGS